MISQCRRIFNVEYTASGAAIVTADLLGLDPRNSVAVAKPDSPGTFPIVKSGSQDLIGLDFGTQILAETQSLTRHSSLCRKKSVDYAFSNRDGVIEGEWRRGAVLLCENSEPDLTLLNGTEFTSAEDENPEVAERPVAEDTRASVVKRPVAARRTVRSSSFNGRISSTSSSPGLPVPPPKPNRQRLAASLATFQRQVEELTAQLKCARDERDEALVAVTALEAKLNEYREKFGSID